MYDFIKMNNDNIQDMALLQMDAYPGIPLFMGTTLEQLSERISTTNNRDDVDYYCVNKDGKMVGGFNIWDFKMNMRGTMINVGGLGSVAVDLEHKKEKIAKESVSFFIDHLRNEGANIAALYPFNSAFYHKMGFGFGTLLHQLRIKPQDVAAGDSKKHVKRLDESDALALTDFYNKHVKNTHGLMLKTAGEFESRLKIHANKVFGYVDNTGLHGYISFIFKKGSDENSLINDMVIGDLLFDDPKVFAELMTFVKSQSDQVRYAIFNTQDEGFINTIADPRNHMERMLAPVYQEVCRTGLGIMYRICDVAAFFNDISDCCFGDLNLVLKVNINDSFVSENNDVFLLRFVNGRCNIIKDGAANATLGINIAEFSSLIMGCVGLKSLVKYGKANLSDKFYLDVLHSAFAVSEKPICLSYF